MANMYYELQKKPGALDIAACVESVFQCELDELKDRGEEYPVTLPHFPFDWCSKAINYAKDIFGGSDLYKDTWSCLFADQNEAVEEEIIK
ncbi:hypothetical protein SNE40_012039 [Patella caerulea]